MSAGRKIDQWFMREVIPHERTLTRFLSKYVGPEQDVADLRQELYVRVYETVATKGAPPDNALAFAYVVARNLIVDRSRRAKVISIDFASDPDLGILPVDFLTPERHASAREELRRVELGLGRLPDRCRQVIAARRLEGLSQKECAARMGISEDTVERQLRLGLRALTDFLHGGDGRVRRRPARRRGWLGR